MEPSKQTVLSMQVQPMETVPRKTRESTSLTVETCVDRLGISEATGFTR